MEWNPPRRAISRVPYLPGLDGMRALAVIAVMVYHANHDWLPGGFIGVEVFFVISGYLITLLLIGEHEKTGRIDLKQFWLRRARRLLPALFVMMALLMTYCALFKRDRLGEIRGDIVAGVAYVSNWYQIFVGQGYTSGADFAPLRHLWSLAVEEQFYLVWPLVMVGLISLGRRRLPNLSRWLLVGALVIAAGMALLFHSGSPADPSATWEVGGRSISKNDALYLSTITRATGLLVGAAFAMLWRPIAVMRGPLRNKGRQLDVIAAVGLVGLGALAWVLEIVREDGSGDPWLYRGGFLAVALGTVLVMAAVTHRAAAAGPILGNPVLNWVGTRSYGLYLFHWPVYQIIRGTAGNKLDIGEFLLAMAITLPITEASYRVVETPIRTRQLGRWWRRITEQSDPKPRQAVVLGAAAVVALFGFSAVSMAGAELKPNELEQSFQENEDAVTDLGAQLTGSSVPPDAAPASTTVPAPTTIAADASATNAGAAPQPTAAPPTTPAPTTAASTQAPLAGGELAIGDSVMLGAASPLRDAGFTVDAEESRQFGDYVPVVEDLAASGQLPQVVVVHLGTNGTIDEDDAYAFFDALKDVPIVVVLTVWVPKSWAAPNNEIIMSLPARYPNVSIGYWADVAPNCTDNCYAAADGFHLNANGADYYANYIRAWVTQRREAAGL